MEFFGVEVSRRHQLVKAQTFFKSHFLNPFVPFVSMRALCPSVFIPLPGNPYPTVVESALLYCPTLLLLGIMVHVGHW